MSDLLPRRGSATPRIRVLIPAYNAAMTIAETIGSLSASPAVSLSRVVEIVVADDGSTDETIRVAESVPSPCPLRVLRSESNRGERTTTNEAISSLSADTDWCLLIHADDLARPGWLPEMITAIDALPPTVGTLSSSWDTIRGSRVEPGDNDTTTPWHLIMSSRAAIGDTLLQGTWWHLSGCAIRTKAFQAVGGFDVRMPQLGDQDWLLRTMESGWGVAYIPRSLIGYRLHEASVSSVSMRLDRDVREALIILERFGHYLSPRGLLIRHLKMVRYISRRAARAVLSGDPPSLGPRIVLTFQILASLARSLRNLQPDGPSTLPMGSPAS